MKQTSSHAHAALPMPSLASLSVRSKLLLLVAVFAASLSAIFGWSLYLDNRRAEDAAFSEVKYVSEAMASNIDLALRERQVELESLANRPLTRALSLGACDPFVAEFVRMQPEYATFTTRDLDGNIACSLTDRPFSPEQARGLDWFQKSRRSEQPLVGNAYLRSATQRWAIALTYPIKSDAGALRGVAILPIDLLKFNEQLQRAFRNDVQIVVADAEGQIVLRSTDPENRIGRPISPGFRDKSLGKSSSLFKEQGIAMQERLWSHVALPNIGWHVYAGILEAQVLAPSRQSLYRNLLLGVFALALLLMVSWWIGSSVVNPIDGLAAASKSIAESGLATPVAVSGPPEIRAVAMQFNRMLERRGRDEADLRESETRFRMLTELSADWYWEQDAEFRYTKMEALGAGTAISNADFWLGKTRWEGNLLNMTEAAWEAHCQLINSHQPYRDLRFQFDYGNGHVQWAAVSGAPIFDEDGNFTGYRGVGRDLTQQYAAEESLRLLEASVSQLNDMVIITEATQAGQPEWRIVFVNPAFERITGYPAAEAIGKSPSMLQGPKTDRAGLDRIRQARLLNQAVIAELVNYSKSGREYWVEIAIAPVVDGSGKVTHFVGVERDITERKNAELEHESLVQRLHQSQKMEAIGVLAGGIAHDFNNILGAILGNVELARQDSAACPAALESLDEIRKAGIRARELIQQILSFSRRQSTVRQVISLREIVADSRRMLRMSISSQLNLEADLGTRPLPILGDATQLQQVLLNLVTNAGYAMAGQLGLLRISVEREELTTSRASATGTIPAGRYAVLRVTDSGSGISAEELPRLFEPFFTTKPLGEGTGLGLAVVHGIVIAAGGYISVESELGKGTTFAIYFPEVDEAATAPPKQLDHSASALAGTGQHIIYLDDDESMTFLMERFLARRGYQVSVFTNQQHALDELQRDPQSISLFVTDFNMPGLSGLQVASEARKIRADLPIAISSGYITDQLRADAKALGINEVIFKPNGVDEFCDLIQRLMAGSPAH